AACPPYHLSIVIGGTSAELTMKTVKLASTKYYDTLPDHGSAEGHASRDKEMEKGILKMTPSLGVGGQLVKIAPNKPMKEILAQLAQYPIKTRLSLNGPMIVARDIAHAKLRDRL